MLCLSDSIQQIKIRYTFSDPNMTALTDKLDENCETLPVSYGNNLYNVMEVLVPTQEKKNKTITIKYVSDSGATCGGPFPPVSAQMKFCDELSQESPFECHGSHNIHKKYSCDMICDENESRVSYECMCKGPICPSIHVILQNVAYICEVYVWEKQEEGAC